MKNVVPVVRFAIRCSWYTDVTNATEDGRPVGPVWRHLARGTLPVNEHWRGLWGRASRYDFS